MPSQRLTDDRSVPILKVNANIGILPLIIPMTNAMMPDISHQCIKAAYSHLVIDLSGIPAISSDELSKMILTLENIGVRVIVSGLRSDTVQSLRPGAIPADPQRCFPDLYHALASLEVPMKPRRDT